MTPKIGICKNEKIDFFARESKHIPTVLNISNDQSELNGSKSVEHPPENSHKKLFLFRKFEF
jgi:hypothetical protein